MAGRSKIPEEAGRGPDALQASRRSFLKGMGAAAGAAMILPAFARAEEEAAAGAEGREEIPGLKVLGRDPVAIELKINGETHALTVEPRATLLEVLRHKLDLTGAKEICDRGACSGCTVLIDGRAVISCLLLAVDVQGREIVTAEGIAGDPRYRNLVEAFHESDAAQCGYCIPGFLVSAAAFLERVPSPSAEQIREGLSGNLCRCGTYTKLFDAVAAAAAKGGVQ